MSAVNDYDERHRIMARIDQLTSDLGQLPQDGTTQEEDDAEYDRLAAERRGLIDELRATYKKLEGCEA